ncbi:MAG TPA: hypothetical protein VLA69_09830 [Gaiellaceae bacterium]|nr:hypothetical protein [Gaiellaceae bacterium]
MISLESNTADRAGAVAFGVIAGFVTAGLVWAGYGAGRLTRRGTRTA